MTNDWIEHDGGPQPVADDVWICVDAMPEEMEEVGAGYARLPKQVGSWKHVTGFFVLNQHLIDAALKRGIELGLEASNKAIGALYANDVTDRQMALEDASMAVCALNPEAIAREAVLDQLTSEAQADNMGYDHDDAKETAR